MNKIQVGTINGIPVYTGNPDYIKQGEYYLDSNGVLKTRSDLGPVNLFKESKEVQHKSILDD